MIVLYWNCKKLYKTVCLSSRRKQIFCDQVIVCRDHAKDLGWIGWSVGLNTRFKITRVCCIWASESVTEKC